MQMSRAAELIIPGMVKAHHANGRREDRFCGHCRQSGKKLWRRVKSVHVPTSRIQGYKNTKRGRKCGFQSIAQGVEV